MKKYIQVTESKQPIAVIQADNIEQLKDKFILACSEHFGSDDINFIGISSPDLNKIINQNGQNIKILAYDCKIWIDLKETWLY